MFTVSFEALLDIQHCFISSTEDPHGYWGVRAGYITRTPEPDSEGTSTLELYCRVPPLSHCSHDTKFKLKFRVQMIVNTFTSLGHKFKFKFKLKLGSTSLNLSIDLNSEYKIKFKFKLKTRRDKYKVKHKFKLDLG